jgi:anthranilate phosphoribosyltransferase
MQAVLQGRPSPLMESTILSGGFYLWQSGVCVDMESGLAYAKELLMGGRAAQKLVDLRESVFAASSSLYLAKISS